MRRFAIVLVNLLAGVMLAGSLVAAAAANDVVNPGSRPAPMTSRQKAAKPMVKVLNPNASQLSKGRIKLRVKAQAGALVRLSATSRTFDNGEQRLFKARNLRLGKGGQLDHLPEARPGHPRDRELLPAAPPFDHRP